MKKTRDINDLLRAAQRQKLKSNPIYTEEKEEPKKVNPIEKVPFGMPIITGTEGKTDTSDLLAYYEWLFTTERSSIVKTSYKIQTSKSFLKAGSNKKKKRKYDVNTPMGKLLEQKQLRQEALEEERIFNKKNKINKFHY